MATYIILNLIVTMLVLAWVLVMKRRLSPVLVITLLVLLAMTAVFDNLIVLAGIVTYDPTHNLHIAIGVAPVEDFFYPLVAVLIVPALWHNKGNYDR